MRSITYASSMADGFGKNDDWSGRSGAVECLCDRGRIELQQFAQSAGLQAIRTESKFTKVKYFQDIELARMTERHVRILLLAGRGGNAVGFLTLQTAWSFRPAA
jgi:hypothetical protein